MNMVWTLILCRGFSKSPSSFKSRACRGNTISFLSPSRRTMLSPLRKIQSTSKTIIIQSLLLSSQHHHHYHVDHPHPPRVPPSALSVPSPARVRKLISSHPDPHLALEIFRLSPSPKSLPTLILRLSRSPKTLTLSLSLLQKLPKPLLSPPLLSSLFLTISSSITPPRPDLLVSLLNTYVIKIPPLPTKHLNRILSALSSHPSSLPAALSLLNSTPASSLSVRSFNILISAFSKSNTISIAYSLFNKMQRDHGLSPDSDTFRTLMRGLCRKSQVSTAVSLLDDMLNRGLSPDPTGYATLLNSLCRKKQLREAYKMLCRMKVRGCNPDILHYNTVIVGICREGRPVDACKVLDEMPDRGCLPNLVSYTSLINGLCGSGMLEMGGKYLEEMVGRGIVPHFSVFHGLVKGFCGLGKVEEACRVMDRMLWCGVEPHVESWAAVVGGVCDEDWERLRRVLLRVVSDDEWRRSTRIVQSSTARK